MINRISVLSLLLMAYAFAPSQLSADETTNSWPKSEFDNYIASCRHSVLSEAYADYLRRQGMSAEEVAAQPYDSLSPDQQEYVEAGFEHFLTVCDCLAGLLATKIPYQEALQNPDALMLMEQEIINSGECAPQSS